MTDNQPTTNNQHINIMNDIIAVVSGASHPHLDTDDGQATLYRVEVINTKGDRESKLVFAYDGESGAAAQAACSGDEVVHVEHAGPVLLRGWSGTDFNPDPDSPFDPRELKTGDLFEFHYNNGTEVTIMKQNIGAVVVALRNVASCCEDKPGKSWTSLDPTDDMCGELVEVTGDVVIPAKPQQ